MQQILGHHSIQTTSRYTRLTQASSGRALDHINTLLNTFPGMPVDHLPENAR